MGCFGKKGKVAPDGGTEVDEVKPTVGPLAADRKCRDIICLLLFIAFWVGWLFIALLAFTDGCPNDCNTPMRLLYGYDSQGDACKDSTKQMFIGIPLDLTGSRVCLNGCPSTLGDLICVDSQGKFTETVPTIPTMCMVSNVRVDCCYVSYPTKEIMFKCVPDISDVPTNSTTDTQQALNSALGDSSTLSSSKSFAESPTGALGNAFSQVIMHWPILVASIFVALAFGFVWLLLLRMFVKVMVMATIIGVGVLLLGITIMLLGKAGIITLGASTSTAGVSLTEDEAKVLAYIFVVITAVYLLLMIVFFKRLLIACNILTEAGKAMGAMPMTSIFPVFTYLVVVVLLIWFVFVSLYLASAGEFDPTTMTFSYPDTTCINKLKDAGADETYAEKTCNTNKGDATESLKVFEAFKTSLGGNFTASANITSTTYENPFGITLNSETYDYFIVYHLFGFLWTYAFILGVGYLTLAGAFATWYWTMDKKKLPRAPILKSFYRACRYHLGSVAFGAFILAVVQMIRIIFNYIMNKMNKHKDNKIVKILQCCVNCMLKCLERFIDFLNRNAYIMIAIHGKSFCTSALNAFKLIMKNVLQIAAVNVVGDAVLFLGKVVVCIGTAFVAYAYFNAVAEDPTLIPEAFRPSSTDGIDPLPIFPMLCVIFIGWMVGAMFMSVYETGIDTIFLSFCEDREINDGSTEKPFYMGASLKSALGVKNKEGGNSNKVAPSD